MNDIGSERRATAQAKRADWRLALAFLVVWFGGQSAASAQEPRTLDNGQVQIAYEAPKDEAHQPIYERLQQRRVLDQLKQFLAPLRLDKTLLIKTAGCDGQVNAWFMSSEGSITICYEYIEDINKYAAKTATPEGASPEDTIIGPFVEVLFHELGHAVFNYLRVPIWGREEDAADQAAAFLLLQFGPDVARRTLLGTAHYQKSGAERRKLSKRLFADEHGLDWQRYYTMLCLAYGGYPETFRPLVEKTVLPEARARGCAREYKQVERAFVQHVLPHIDRDLMKQVQAREWLPPEGAK